MDVEIVRLLDEETKHVWLEEGGLEFHGHVIISKLGKLKVNEGHGGVMITLGYVPDIDIEQLIPMVLDESQVDWVAPLEDTRRVSGDVRHLKSDIGEVEIFHGINLVTGNLDSAVMWVHNCVRVLLLYDNSEVEGETLIPNTIWSENKGIGLVVEEQEWWVLLVRHAVDIDLWDIVTFWIRKGWQFVLVDVANGELPGSLNISYEIRVVVVEDLDIEIELNKLIES